MAEGIRKLHSKGCGAREGGRCSCKAGWEASVFARREGKRVYKTFKRESEAKSWRADAKRALDSGALRAPASDQPTLGEALARFVDAVKAGTIRPKGRERYKPNTVRSYERALRVHIRDAPIAELKVGEIRRRDVQAFVNGLLADGFASGTVSNTLNPIQAFYRDALDNEEVAVNPAVRINVAYGASERPKRIASPSEAAALLGALDAEDRPLWATAFYAGLRRGELQALRVCDVDLGASLIHVERGWDQVEGPISPKSRAGRRTVPLLAILRDYLDEHLLRTGRSGEELVFGRSATEAFYASTIDGRAKRAWRAHNRRQREAAEGETVTAGNAAEPDLLTPITMHECRHTFASLLIDSGANAKVIQAVMGHSKIATTFDVYGHLLPGSHDEVRLRMDAYLEGAHAA